MNPASVPSAANEVTPQTLEHLFLLWRNVMQKQGKEGFTEESPRAYNTANRSCDMEGTSKPVKAAIPEQQP